MGGHAARVPLHNGTTSQWRQDDTLTGRRWALHVDEDGQVIDGEVQHSVVVVVVSLEGQGGEWGHLVDTPYTVTSRSGSRADPPYTLLRSDRCDRGSCEGRSPQGQAPCWVPCPGRGSEQRRGSRRRSRQACLGSHPT